MCVSWRQGNGDDDSVDILQDKVVETVGSVHKPLLYSCIWKGTVNRRLFYSQGNGYNYVRTLSKSNIVLSELFRVGDQKNCSGSVTKRTVRGRWPKELFRVGDQKNCSGSVIKRTVQGRWPKELFGFHDQKNCSGSMTKTVCSTGSFHTVVTGRLIWTSRASRHYSEISLLVNVTLPLAAHLRDIKWRHCNLDINYSSTAIPSVSSRTHQPVKKTPARANHSHNVKQADM